MRCSSSTYVQTLNPYLWLQLCIGENRFSITPERWLPSANFTGLKMLIEVNISRNLFSGKPPPPLPACMQRSVRSAPTLPSYQYHLRTPCLHTACAQCWYLYLRKQDCTRHSLRNLKACMQRTVAATSERVVACRPLPQPAVGGQQLEDAGHVIQQLQVRTRLCTPAP